VLWSFAHADWDNAKQPDPDSATKKILSETHNGEIILLHPTSSTNAEILPTLIREWKKMGYRFGTLYELGA
jgi:peptidoglycan-N-acetylmuramic acid deacetylase